MVKSSYGEQHEAPVDTGSFRRLVEQEITVDEYVERLDERVRERHEAEDRPAKAAASNNS